MNECVDFQWCGWQTGEVEAQTMDQCRSLGFGRGRNFFCCKLCADKSINGMIDSQHRRRLDRLEKN